MCETEPQTKEWYLNHAWVMCASCCCGGIQMKQITFLTKMKLGLGMLENAIKAKEMVCVINPALEDVKEYFHHCCGNADWDDLEICINACNKLDN